MHHSAAGGGNDFRIFFPLQRFWSFLCLSQRYCIISYTNITITVTSLRHYLHKSIHTFCSQSVRYFFVSCPKSILLGFPMLQAASLQLLFGRYRWLLHPTDGLFPECNDCESVNGVVLRQQNRPKVEYVVTHTSPPPYLHEY